MQDSTTIQFAAVGTFGKIEQSNQVFPVSNYLAKEATADLWNRSMKALAVTSGGLLRLLGAEWSHMASDWRNGRKRMSQLYSQRLNRLLLLKLDGVDLAGASIDWDTGQLHPAQLAGVVE